MPRVTKKTITKTRKKIAKGSVQKVPLKKTKKKLVSEQLVTSSREPKSFSMNSKIAMFGFLGIVVGVLVYFFFFQGQVDLASDERPEIVLPEEETALPPDEEEVVTEEPSEPVVEVLKIRILDTPPGYLNVRTGPGLGFEQFTRVSPGESYELVSENEQQTWYQIKINDETNGWVIKTYAELE